MKQVATAIKTYRQHFCPYLLVLLSLDLFNQLALLPLFKMIMSFLLPRMALPFVSWLNLRLIITHKPFLFILLVLTFIIFIWLFYLEIVFLASNLLSIRRGKSGSFKLNLAFNPALWGLSLLNFFTSLPLLILIFRTPLFAEFKLPEFILDYGLRSFWLGCLLCLAYLLLFWLTWRLTLVWPLLIRDGISSKQAFKRSWHLTKTKVIRQKMVKLLLLGGKTAAGMLLFYLLLFLGQRIADLFPGQWPRICAMVNLLLLQLGAELGLSFWLTTVCLKLAALGKKRGKEQLIKKKSKNEERGKLAAFLLLFLLLGIAAKGDYFYLQVRPAHLPLTISHRGVDQENSVQNTIAALRKIHREKPDLVEMDVHETKDHQFVVLHDENLNHLADRQGQPSQLTLKELTRLRLHENGYHAKMASFTAYLKTATALRQRLLVEIKTTPHDSADSMKLFNAKYGRQLLKNHDQVQSLDYRVVKKLRHLNPRLSVFYLQPYNFIWPRTRAKGYAMEYSTVNSAFVRRAHAAGQPVYVWTVNDVHLMRRMISEQVDGIITDRLSVLKRVIKEYRAQHSYAHLLLNYAFVLPTKFDITA